MKGNRQDDDTAEDPTADSPRFLLSRRDVLGGMAVAAAGATVAAGTASASMGALVPASEATHRAVASGSWGDPSTWADGTVPTDGARALVEEGVTVTLARETARLDWLRVEGTLSFDTATDSHLKAEHVVSVSGSTVEVGTANTPVQSGVEARMTFLDPGPLDESTDPERKGRGLLVGGALSVHGAEKTSWSELSTAPTAGDTQLELADAPTNWEPGDRLVVPGMAPNERQEEQRVVESVDAATVTLDAPLDYDHVPPASDLDAYVSNLSRNVVLTSESTATKRRGHVMIMSTATDVRYATFRDLGRTNKDEPLTNPVRNAGSVSSSDSNVSARYSFHYHHTGIGAEPHYAEGIVADGSPGWGIVNHHAHAEITDSVTHDVSGAGFVAEGGNERGSFKRCIAVGSDGSGETIDSRSAGAHGGDPPIDDFGHAGHGFWLQSPLVAVTNCVAADHRHQAFVWWLRPLLDGDLAEGTEVSDSRVTFHPNLPLEYVDTSRIQPLLGAIKEKRFSNDDDDELMWETQKIPSTFAPVAKIRGNVAFASAGGVDFSRHNFKWKHERFSDFSTIDDMTVHSIGPFVDADGAVHEPDLPKHQASGHQGRGGSVGVSFRYTSNVTLENSRILGSGRENSVGVPFHDYQWTTVTDNCTIENWDWGVDTGEHAMDWVRNSTFRNNSYDVNWGFDNVGPAILDDNELERVRHQFERLNRKASDVLTFSRDRGVRIDGRSSHVADSAADNVIFPDEDSLGSINNIESTIDSVDDETNLVGLTNQEMYDQYGICASGRVMPDDAVAVDYVDDGHLDPSGGRTPPTSVFLDATTADQLGMFEVVSAQDVSGGQCLRSGTTDSPKSNPAALSFDCAAGTYEVYFRFRSRSWNGDEIYYRIDGGDWYTAEKLKQPASPKWHGAAPNGEPNYEHDLSEGGHTIEFATEHDGRLIDEVFIGSDGSVIGAYGASQSTETDAEAAPTVGNLSLSEIETKNSDAEFDAAWAVSDDDGDLDSVDLTLTQDGTTVDSATLSVSGSSASGTTRLVATGDEGTGNSYTVEATATDSSGATASATASATESENVPNVDDLTLSEVETSSSDAEFDASWAVSDSDGDLSTVDLTLTDDTAGDTEETASLSVGGDSASGTTRLVAAGDDGSGNSYTVEATVTDGFDETDTATASATAATENTNPPTVDGITLSEVETENSDAEFDASWAVSDSDGDLSTLDLTLTDETSGGTEETASLSVGGDSASGTTRLVAAGDDGSGNSYTVEATVTDDGGETDTATASAGEGENAPAVDSLSVSEVETENSDAEFDASWDLSDDDGDLSTLDLALSQDADDTAEEAISVSVSGTSASGTTRLVAAGDDGSGNSYTVEATATDAFGQTGSAADTVQEGEPSAQEPYADHDLGQIEAEDFDTGGEGVAYHDTSSGNNGGAYRDTDVDIQKTRDDSGAYNLCWIEDGEWWEYTVEVPEDGEYELQARLAGKNATSLKVAVDGSAATVVDVPNTGGWQEWTTVDAGPVSLTSGTHTIRLTANGGDFNINWFGFGQSDGQAPYTDHDLGRIEAEDFDTGGEGVAYHDTTVGNKGGAYRDTDVDIQRTEDTDGTYNLYSIRKDEWLEYTVEVPEDGSYDLKARVAGKKAGSFDVAVDGSQVETIDIPETGGWQSWSTVDAGTVELTAGTHTIRLTADWGQYNLNWFGFQ